METVRKIQLNELRYIYEHIVQDFAEGEYPPYDKLYYHLENNIQTGWVLMMDGRDAAYSICAEGADGYVLISYFAVYKENRGRGIGTLFLEKLKEIYSESKGIIVEIEKPEDARHEEEVQVRKRRYEFYSRAGFSFIPGIEYVIWDVPMHLLVYPCKNPLDIINKDIGRIMYEIYLLILGKSNIHRLEFRRL